MYRTASARRIRRSSSLLIAALAPAAAIAQTCQSPLPLVNNQVHSGSTCNYGASLPAVDGIALQHRQVIYKLTSNTPLSGAIDFSTSSFSGATGLVMAGCGSQARAISIFDPQYQGSAWSLPDGPAGDYYLMITGDPSVPAPPQICGNYTFTPHLATAATAGSCAAPISYRRSERMMANTCTATNTLPTIAQSVASPQRDMVYRINRANMTTDRLYLDSSGPDMLAVVQSACTMWSPALAWAGIPAGGSSSINLAGLPVGDHYLVVTADPAGPANSCGSVGLTDLPPGVTRSSTAFAGLILPGYYAESFTNLPPRATTQLMNFSSNGFFYSIVPQGSNALLAHVTGMQSQSGQALAVTSTSTPRSLRITFGGGRVTAVSGVFGLTGLPVFPVTTAMTISLRRGTQVSTFRLDGATGGFWGFSGSSAIDEMIISQTTGQGRPTVDNLVVGRTR